MKIAVIGGAMGGYGGTEQHVYDLCRSLKEDGYEVRPIIGPNKSVEILEADGFDVRRPRMVKVGGTVWRRTKNLYLRAPFRIANFARLARGVNLIHVHTPDDYFYAYCAARLLRIPVVLTSHGHTILPEPFFSQKRNWLMHKMLKWALSHADVTISVSEYNNHEIAEAYFSGRVPDNFTLNYLAPRGELVEPRLTENLVERSHSEPVVVGVCSRLHPIKRLDVVIKAMVHIKNAGFKWKLEIWGDTKNKYKDRLIELVGKFGLDGLVEFRGWTDNARETIRRFDINIVPTSDDEPFALSKIEGWMAGLPVIAFSNAGGKEGMVHLRNGIVSRSGAPGDLAHYIVQLVTNDRLRQLIQIGGQNSVRDFFNWERSYEEILLAYDKAEAKHL